ncbi:MAG: aspartoacylase [Oscillatoriophycideae cyanobacterium NC_groundwater_1537_Pr4_S-0.65um_50_18]|nr:aspartoacylase [Oscillatoriophycideae cyanobacterium NC_groundwater_1537_Pr4_S-0.65um_50_18]
MNKMSHVLIVGGTHGNELTGAYLTQKFQQSPHLLENRSFQVQTLLGNPKAFAKGVRYIDQDLNRSFDRPCLQNADHSNYESQRAREISQSFEANFDASTTVIIDIHSTTANMGLTLILNNHDAFNLQLAAYLSSEIPSLKVYSSEHSGRNRDSLRSLSKFGLAIEIGSLAQGTLNAELFQNTENLVYKILNYLEEYNRGSLKIHKGELKIYQYLESIDYPRDEAGNIQAMIHPQLQSRDYEALHPGDPMFLTFDYASIMYTGESVVYPVFINEAAYYEKGIAMCLTKINIESGL